MDETKMIEEMVRAEKSKMIEEIKMMEETIKAEETAKTEETAKAEETTKAEETQLKDEEKIIEDKIIEDKITEENITEEKTIEEKQKKNGLDKNLQLIPIYIMSAVIPLIVYMKFINLKGIFYVTWKGMEDFGDFFNYYKAVGIIVTAAIALIMLLLNRRKNQLNLKEQAEFIPAAIYLLLIIISTIFSEYITVAIYGFTERYEGMPVLISYIVICFYTAVIVKKEKDTKKVLVFLGTSCVLIGIIGAFQYFGLDLFQTKLGLKLILPPAYQHLAEKMQFLYSGKIIYGTLYNPNFVGSYSSMLLLVSLGMLYYTKEVKHKIAVGLLFCGSAFVLWIGSMSRAGLIGGVLGLIIFFVLQFKNITKNWKHTVSIFIYFVAIYFVLNGFSGGRVIQEFNRINPITENERMAELSERLYVEEIKTENMELVVKTSTEELRIQQESDKVAFYDGQGAEVEANYAEGAYTFDNEPYKKYKLSEVEHEIDNIYTMDISGYQFIIRYTDQGFKRLNPVGLDTKIGKAESVPLFDGKESFASGRGFIWSRSIPMVKNTILKGYGPDTYAIYFPQWDVAGKINGLHNPTTIVDKPHNWYLQIAINTGLISLLAVIAFIFIYLFKTLKVHFKSNEKQGLVLQSAVFAAIISYCMAGFFNDSVVPVAPVFWVLLGLGIAMNKGIYSKIAYDCSITRDKQNTCP